VDDHGKPAQVPSILVPGQLLMNHFASAHDVICER
jgi:hypothetical protein